MNAYLRIQNVLRYGARDHVNEVFRDDCEFELRLGLIDMDVLKDEHRIFQRGNCSRITQQPFDKEFVIAGIVFQSGEQAG